MLKIVLPFLVGITTIDSIHRLKALAWMIMLSQGYVAFELNVSYYQGLNRVQLMGFGGMDNNCVSIAMVACTGLAFFLGLHTEQWWAKLLCLALALLMVHSVFFAFSRGGMLALIVTAAVIFVLIPKQLKHYLLFALIVLVGLRLAGPEVQQRFVSSFAGKDERDESAANSKVIAQG
jgi:O-antigen ligase